MKLRSTQSAALADCVQGTGKVGVFFANGIGDHLMVLPAVRAITGIFGKRVTLFAMLPLLDLFFGRLPFGGIAPVVLYEDRDGCNRFTPEAVADGIADIQLFISLNPWHSAEVDALLAHLKPAMSIGLYEQFDIYAQPCSGEHSCDRAFRIAKTIDPTQTIENYSTPPLLPKHSLLAGRRILAALPAEQKVLAVHNETLDHKMWRDERMTRLINLFLEARPDFVVLALGATNRGFETFGGNPRVTAPLGLPLDAALALVAQADLFLGVDSCMLHMADLCRVPGVGLFGPADSAPLGSIEMGFRFGPHRHVTGNGHMDGIQPKQVLTALTRILPDFSASPRRHIAVRDL